MAILSILSKTTSPPTAICTKVDRQHVALSQGELLLLPCHPEGASLRDEGSRATLHRRVRSLAGSDDSGLAARSTHLAGHQPSCNPLYPAPASERNVTGDRALGPHRRQRDHPVAAAHVVVPDRRRRWCRWRCSAGRATSGGPPGTCGGCLGLTSPSTRSSDARGRSSAIMPAT